MSQAKNPDHYALVIGINGYRQLPALRAAGKDAVRFAEWLRSPDGGGLPEENVALILSPTEPDPHPNPIRARPVHEQVTEVLLTWGVERGERIGQRLYLYFAGHGFGPHFDDIGMLWANASDKRLNFNFGLHPYRRFFKDFQFWDEVVFILDCCRDHERGLPATEAPEFTLEVNGARPGVTDFVVMGSGYGQKAFQAFDERSGERRGLLTEAVLEALKGAPAALDERGRVTAATLQKYLEARVPELAREANLEQTPEVDPPARELVLVAFSREKEVRIVTPPGLTGDLVLRDASFQELSRRPAEGANAGGDPWTVPLVQASRYLIEHVPSGRVVFLDTPQGAAPFEFLFPELIRIRIGAPPGIAGDVVVRGDAGEEIARRPAAEVTDGAPAWVVTLVRGVTYRIEYADLDLNFRTATRADGSTFQLPDP